MNPLETGDVRQKISMLEGASKASLAGSALSIPLLPGRDAEVVSIAMARGKPGLSTKEGQARLLHDLASIELQAMELAFRSLVEYPQADSEFRAGLAELAISESRHLEMCLDGIEKLGFKWGEWPVHLALWNSVSETDSILDRLLIVHRYLEGSGLDAGVSILNRLNGTADLGSVRIVKTIVDEEVGHVSFGSEWYRRFCDQNGIDWRSDFSQRLPRLMAKIPRRLEKINREIRRRAGFTEQEMDFLEGLQDSRPWKEANA